MHPQPLICVRDVEASSRWYQRLLGCRSDHGGPNYERLVASGKLVLQLHKWEVEDHHGRIGDPDDLPPGNGVVLWFEIEDFDAAIARVETMAALAAMIRPCSAAARSALILELRRGFLEARCYHACRNLVAALISITSQRRNPRDRC